MAGIRINTRNHTKEKPHLIDLFFFFKIGKAKKKIEKKVNRMSKIQECMLERYTEEISVTFPGDLKMRKAGQK